MKNLVVYCHNIQGLAINDEKQNLKKKKIFVRIKGLTQNTMPAGIKRIYQIMGKWA
jgi:hypothetical protein